MFKLVIATPHGIFYNGSASLLNIKSSDGYLTILPHHMPLMTSIEIAPIYFINEKGQKEECACAEGTMYVNREEVKLIVEAIEYKRDIDLERAQTALQLASELLDNSQNQKEAQKAEITLKRALNRINVKNHS